MGRRRDRWMALGAVVVVLALAAVIVVTVLDAQRRGRDALERNQRSAIDQLASAMEQRVVSAIAVFADFVRQPLTFEVGDPADAAVLQGLQDLSPDAESGYLLVRADATVTNGTLLVDPSVVGARLERPGLDDVLETGQAAILPATGALTTDQQVLTIATPVLDEEGAVVGAFLLESVVSEDSAFNAEIASLRQGDTGRYTFLDERGTVIASSDPDLLARPFEVTDLSGDTSGLARQDGLVVGVAAVPSADWRLVFTQDAGEFESGLGERVQAILLIVIVTTLVGAAVVFVAVLRRLRLEREERRRIEEINEAREEFISIVSHELRTPVSGIVGFLHSALDHWETMDEADRRHAITRASANAQRLQALTRDVLDSASVERGDLLYEFDLIDLRREVETAVIAAQDAEEERLIRIEMTNDPAWVRADPDRIQQVLANLLDNAAKNSPATSPISVRLSIDGDEARVAVADEGAGLGDAQMDQVFEKFVRGRSTVRGTGLGLYIARRIVEAHGGRIWATPGQPKGAVFGFALPLTSAASEPLPAGSETA